MKKIIVFNMLLIMSATSFSQQTNPSPVLVKQDYLQKSKNQKTAAWICFGTGAALLAIAAPGNVSFDILPVLVVGSGGLVVGSIPLFIAASRNKRKAKKVSALINMETVPLIGPSGSFSSSFPVGMIKISL
jgi:hypothetical protein